MEKSTEPQPSTQWFVFFKDQLLLKKGYTDKGEIKYSVPVSIEPPLTPEAGSNIHEVFPPQRQASTCIRLGTARGRNRRMGHDRPARIVRLHLAGRVPFCRKGLPDTLLGRAQPLLPRVWYRHGAPDPHHEEVSQLRQ